MKLIPDFDIKEKVVIQAEQEREYKMIGSLRKKPGQILFEYNPETKEVKVAEILSEIQLNIMTEKAKGKHKTNFNNGCVYFFALNLKNAQRKVGIYDKYYTK